MRGQFHDNYIPVPESGCWLWINATNPQGYGRMKKFGRDWQAHRLAWTLLRGPIPDGIFVCHKCDTPQCVNPDHLFLGTPKENAMDMSRKGRVGNTKKTACIRGHFFAGENLSIDSKGKRVCRSCAKDRYRRRDARIAAGAQ